jgi:hypothetical protein
MRNNFFLTNANPFVVGMGAGHSNAGMLESLSSVFSATLRGAWPAMGGPAA